MAGLSAILHAEIQIYMPTNERTALAPDLTAPSNVAG
jgi:hypothetical protein